LKETWTRTAFLQALHPTGYHDLRALDCNTRTFKEGCIIPATDLDGINQFTTKHESRWDIYTGVATRKATGGKLVDCLALYALFVDMDFKEYPSEEAAQAVLTSYPFQPSIVINSGGGLHCYWLLTEALDLQTEYKTPKVREILRALAKSLHADMKSGDAAHILRVPGTFNHKYTPARPVTLQFFNQQAVYALSDIIAYIGPIPDPAPPRHSVPPQNLTVKEKIRQARDWLVRQKPAIEGDGGDNHTYTICCFLRIGFDLSEDEAMVALTPWNARCTPPWTEKDLRQKLRNAERSGQDKQARGSQLEPARIRIVLRGGAITSIIDTVESALVESPIQIYQRGNVLTRPVVIDYARDDTVQRSAGSIVLMSVRDLWLREQMGKVARWVRVTSAGKKQLIDPPVEYARTLLERNDWRFPTLRGIVTAPTLDRDGRIVAAPGFDEPSGLLLDYHVGTFPPVPESPTREQARAALDLLGHPLRSFPFVSDAAQSVALSALLTALVRPSLRTSPLHGYDAPTAGSGKSMLAEAVGLLASGTRPPAMSQSTSVDEDQKRLAAVLFAGDSVIHIDNCERAIQGEFLCSLLTQEDVQARVLGHSEMRKIPCTALVLASGNNLTFAGDATRRAVICRLDAQVERPDTREFDFDVHDEIRMARPELVVAGLTVLRAYIVAGRPVKLQPMGSFNDWEWIRGALVWLDRADPADTRLAILDNDPQKSELLEMMELWAESIGPNSYLEVPEIDRRAELFEDKGPNEIKRREKTIELRNRFVDLCCRGKWSAKSVGWWLRRNKGRVIGNQCFDSRMVGDRQQWALVQKTLELR
jgi:hypothetical protein